MEPHVSYAKLMQLVMRLVDVRGMAHITGGGITENFPRILPEGLAAEVNLESWEVPGVFRFLQEAGSVEELEMLRTFNLGVGFMLVVPEGHVAKALETIELAGKTCQVVGRITRGDRRVHYIGKLRYAGE